MTNTCLTSSEEAKEWKDIQPERDKWELYNWEPDRQGKDRVEGLRKDMLPLLLA